MDKDFLYYVSKYYVNTLLEGTLVPSNSYVMDVLSKKGESFISALNTFAQKGQVSVWQKNGDVECVLDNILDIVNYFW